jgi:hypothetical protein
VVRKEGNAEEGEEGKRIRYGMGRRRLNTKLRGMWLLPGGGWVGWSHQ